MARESAEASYRAGQTCAIRRLQGNWGMMTLAEAISRADANVEFAERDTDVTAWYSRGYRDTLVEHRDSVGDV
jgi:hypothetical protein